MTNINVHNVKSVTVENVLSLKTCYTKHIVIECEDGNKVEIVMYSDRKNNLNLLDSEC